MLRVKHLLIGLLAVIAGTGITYGRNKSTEHQRLEPETLQYRVMYKWGLINKQAGSATLTLTHKAKNYQAKLSAKSEPWADRIFRVRDTLNGHMTYSDFTPLYYEKSLMKATSISTTLFAMIIVIRRAYRPTVRERCIRKAN